MVEIGHVARASTTIDAPPDEVWDALLDPAKIERYMAGARVTSDWHPGSPIVWEGEWQGRPYSDTGSVLESNRGRLLRYTHFSPLSGLPDEPANHHTVTIELREVDGSTQLDLSQDNNETEEAREHSAANWTMMLAGLKEVVEGPQ